MKQQHYGKDEMFSTFPLFNKVHDGRWSIFVHIHDQTGLR